MDTETHTHTPRQTPQSTRELAPVDNVRQELDPMTAKRVLALELKTGKYGSGVVIEGTLGNSKPSVRVAILGAVDRFGSVWTQFDTLDRNKVELLYKWLGAWLKAHPKR